MGPFRKVMLFVTCRFRERFAGWGEVVGSLIVWCGPRVKVNFYWTQDLLACFISQAAYASGGRALAVQQFFSLQASSFLTSFFSPLALARATKQPRRSNNSNNSFGYLDPFPPSLLPPPLLAFCLIPGQACFLPVGTSFFAFDFFVCVVRVCETTSCAGAVAAAGALTGTSERWRRRPRRLCLYAFCFCLHPSCVNPVERVRSKESLFCADFVCHCTARPYASRTCAGFFGQEASNEFFCGESSRSFLCEQ